MSFLKNIVWDPSEYTAAAVIAQEAASGIIARLEWMTLQPQVIVDMGCGTAKLSESLRTLYPQAHIIAVDHAPTMLVQAQAMHVTTLCEDASNTTLAADSVDLIIANFLLPWHDDFQALFQEWRRLLRPDGVVIFTALGPDTLKELKHVFQSEDMPHFNDMHDFGDLLLQEKFAEPVLDVDYYTTTYREKNKMLQELRASGMWFAPQENGSTEMMHALEEAEEFAVTYEVIFAHAFAPTKTNEITASSDGAVRIPLAHLRQQLKSGVK